ncbi:hypothetical protein LTS15_009484 [Exophiala xenobiotica]|nr:hypothetical protein LTS15_009484 [Exophiala xenobiotica]
MELKSEYAFTLYVKLAEPIDFGNTFNGDRRLIPIVGGHFEGPKLKGEILPGGGDWNAVRTDGVVHVYAKYSLRTHDGVPIVITNEGYGRSTQEQMKAVFAGDAPSTPQDIEMARKHWYTKTWPRFEVQHGQHDWLNKSCFVGDLILPMEPNAVQIDVYELL